MRCPCLQFEYLWSTIGSLWVNIVFIRHTSLVIKSSLIISGFVIFRDALSNYNPANCKINANLSFAEKICSCSVTNHLVRVSCVFIAVKNVGSQTSPSSRQANSHDWPSLLLVNFNSLIGGQLLDLQKSCV